MATTTWDNFRMLCVLRGVTVFSMVCWTWLTADVDTSMSGGTLFLWLLVEATAAVGGHVGVRRGHRGRWLRWFYAAYQLTIIIPFFFFGFLLATLGALINFELQIENVLRGVFNDSTITNPPLQLLAIVVGVISVVFAAVNCYFAACFLDL